MPIKVLDPLTASKIAAGEVIEGPHSVVKELIENSLDANAKSIVIKIEDSGKKSIMVLDDGIGMDENDLRICLLRHATSKISDIKDIERLATYGFRGEALFSIFSVSKIKITTYNGLSETGYSLSAHGGDPTTIKITPSPPVKGTSVEVRDLFYNLPARLKFLKSDRTLNANIIKIFEDFALVRPDVKMKLIINNKTIYDLERVERHIKRIEKIINIDTNEILYTEEKFDKLSLKIFTTSPKITFPSKNYSHIYINARPVNAKLITSAILKAYEDIEKRRYPFFIVMIEIEPSQIDVNVHPQKKEVRFKDEVFIYSAVYKTINKLLTSKLKQQTSSTTIPPPHIDIIKEENEIKPDVFMEQNFLNEMYLQQKDEELKISYKQPVRFIGQIFSSILIYQTENSIILLDQHAAAERITYEAYLQEFDLGISLQTLITPVEIKLPKKSDIDKIMDMKDWLAKAGFEIIQSSNNSITVYSVPAIFKMSQDDIKDLFLYLVDVISDPNIISEQLKKNTIASRACKASIKFNEYIDHIKAMDLFYNLIKTADPFRCPHGRPTMIEISRDEIAKKLLRPPNQL